MNADTELGIFTLARVRQKALKALRCQEAPEPQRALALLKDDAQLPSAAERAMPQEALPRGQDTLV